MSTKETETAADLTLDERVALTVIGRDEAWSSSKMAEALASLLRKGMISTSTSYNETTLRLSAAGRTALGLTVKS